MPYHYFSEIIRDQGFNSEKEEEQEESWNHSAGFFQPFSSMAIQFCQDCGDTLPISVKREVPCDCCGKLNPNLILNKTTVTKSSAFPSKLRSQLSLTGSKQANSTLEWPVIDQACEKCGAKETSYTTLQLRGADEGTTVIYYCRECGHR
ncbi:hypothetical protein F5Y14DRAFT_435659 [Nemania sp. NC0429]|nr:hypothetical protein F5Y14DRAFT_435659 [Nemania sp. NC0429]